MGPQAGWQAQNAHRVRAQRLNDLACSLQVLEELRAYDGTLSLLTSASVGGWLYVLSTTVLFKRHTDRVGSDKTDNAHSIENLPFLSKFSQLDRFGGQ